MHLGFSCEEFLFKKPEIITPEEQRLKINLPGDPRVVGPRVVGPLVVGPLVVVAENKIKDTFSCPEKS